MKKKTMTNEEKIEWFNRAIASLEHHAIKSEKCNSLERYNGSGGIYREG